MLCQVQIRLFGIPDTRTVGKKQEEATGGAFRRENRKIEMDKKMLAKYRKTAPNRKQGRRKKCKPEDESGTWKHAATKRNRRHRQRAFE